MCATCEVCNFITMRIVLSKKETHDYGMQTIVCSMCVLSNLCTCGEPYTPVCTHVHMWRQILHTCRVSSTLSHVIIELLIGTQLACEAYNRIKRTNLERKHNMRLTKHNPKKDLKDRLYITDEYIFNGHWILKREHVQASYGGQKAWNSILNMQHGFYYFGNKEDKTNEEMNKLVTDNKFLDNNKGEALTFDKAKIEGIAVNYVYADIPSTDLKIGINAEYFSMLLDMDLSFHASDDDPNKILMLANGKGETVGCVMPMRTTLNDDIKTGETT